MKKISIILLSALAVCGIAKAQEDDYISPLELEDVYLVKISPQGKFAAGQDAIGSMATSCDLTTGIVDWYPACFPGDGNSVSDNGIIAGQEMQMDGMYAALMQNGKIRTTAALKVGGLSQFNAITPDGSRATGYISNTAMVGPTFRPFYCDISPEGTIGEVKMLPCPDLDLFGNKAQYVMGVCISDDGKVILGFVIDSTGSYQWPIIFRQGEDGSWSYSQPTESIFNPNGLVLPENPNNNPLYDQEPKPEDFMNPSKAEEYLEMKAMNPNFDAYWNYMSDSQYNAYIKAHMDWADEVGNWYDQHAGEYNRIMSQMGRDQHFGNIAFISGDGTYAVTAKSGVPYRFNLEDDTFAPLGITTGSRMLTQVLPDGTYVSVSMAGQVPYQTYIRLAGSDSFQLVTDYLLENRPEYYWWFEDSFLNSTGNMVTGVICFSNDLSVFCGGYNDGDGGALSYVYPQKEDNGNGSTGIEEIEVIDGNDAVFEVYNLNGLKIENVKSESDLNTLPKGIYIVNGQKRAI